MESGLRAASLIFSVTGGIAVFVGYRIWRDERTTLVFAPGIDAPDSEIATRSGQVTILAGVATIGLGVGTRFIMPTAMGWLLLLVPYTVICVGSAVWMRWRLS